MSLNLSKILNKSQFTYDKINKCYSANEQNINLNFPINVIEDNLYFFSIEYTSIEKPKLKLLINNNLVSSDFLQIKTYINNRHLTFRYEFGPNNFTEGVLNFEIKCEGNFPNIYSIDFYKVNKSLNHFSNIYPYNINDFILVESFNLYGGFYWHLNNYLLCSYLCEKYNKIPIVNFYSPLFLNNTDMENKLVITNNNWFFNYFQSSTNLPYTLYNTLLNWKKKINLTPKLLSHINNVKKDILLIFNKDIFSIISKDFHSNEDNTDIMKKYFKFLPHINKKIDEIKKITYPSNYFINPKLYKFIGIHYRGTDKISEPNLKEGYPKHYKYKDVYNLLLNKIKTIKNYEVYIIITTDEEQFLNYMIDKFGHKIIYYNNSYRSKINSENINTNFLDIPSRNVKFDYNILNEDKKDKYKQRELLIKNSIHLGTKKLSNYKKGLDCILDVLLLSDVDILYKSTGNFSLFVKLFNKNIKNLEIHNLNNIL